MEDHLYALFCSILYKECEHPRTLVSKVGPGTNILQVLRDDYSFTKSLEVEVEVGNLGEVAVQISSSHKMSQEMLSVFERNKEVEK